jgi:hypothetical protein
MIEQLIYSGQLVRIKIDGTRYVIGVASGNTRRKVTDTRTAFDYNLIGLNTLLQKDSIQTTFAAGASYLSVVRSLINTELGLTEGEMDSDSYLESALIGDGKESAEILGTLATNEGKQWWVNDDLELNYTARLYSHIGSYPEWAPHGVGDIADLTDPDYYIPDYQNLVATEEHTDYANNVFIIGGEYEGITIKSMAIYKKEYDDYVSICGYNARAIYVHSDPNIIEIPYSTNANPGTNSESVVDTPPSLPLPEIAAGDCILNKTRNKLSYITTISVLSTVSVAYSISPAIAGQTTSDVILTLPRLNETAQSMLASKSGFPYMRVSYDTFTPGMLPRQMQSISDVWEKIEGYFMIESVKVKDETAGIFKFSITAEQRPKTQVNAVSTREFALYFNDL